MAEDLVCEDRVSIGDALTTGIERAVPQRRQHVASNLFSIGPPRWGTVEGLSRYERQGAAVNARRVTVLRGANNRWPRASANQAPNQHVQYANCGLGTAYPPRG